MSAANDWFVKCCGRPRLARRFHRNAKKHEITITSSIYADKLIQKLTFALTALDAQ